MREARHVTDERGRDRDVREGVSCGVVLIRPEKLASDDGSCFDNMSVLIGR